jgi:hypothetical protein
MPITNTRQPLPSGSPQFAGVTHDIKQAQTVWGAQMSLPVNLTASVSAGAPYFKIVQLDASTVTWTTVVEDPNDGELPAGHPPVNISTFTFPTLTPAGSSNGASPLNVQNGQWVGLDVSVDVPQGAPLPPGPFTGTVIIQGDNFSQKVDLQCTYLAVALASPIGQKWLALGGEAKLGSVVDLPHTAPDGKGTIQTFANGVLYQVSTAAGSAGTPAVYFLSPAVYAKWATLAEVTDANGAPIWNVLGTPVEDTFATVEGGQALRFHGGAIVVRKNAKAWVVQGAIYQHFEQFGDLSDPGKQPWIGLPVTDEAPVDPLNPGGGQRVSHFDDGDIYWSSASGAWEMHGPILQHWTDVGGFRPGMGLPTTDEIIAPDGVAHFNLFQGGGAIYWTATTGARKLLGPILARWNSLGGVNSYLGYPTSDVGPWATPPAGKSGDICSFQFGQIAATSDGTVIEMPANISITKNGSVSANIGPIQGNLSFSVTITLMSNGDYIFSSHCENHADSGYDYQLQATFTTPAGIWLGAVHSGSMAGNFLRTSGSTTDDHTESGRHTWIPLYWNELQHAAELTVSFNDSPNGVFGFFANQVVTLLEALAVTAVAGPFAGTMFLLGAEAGQAHLGISGTIGVVAGVAVFIATGGNIFLAIAAGVVTGKVSADQIQQRNILPIEYEWANNIFHGTLPPVKNIILTNLTLPGGRFFTAPGIDGNIYVNLGGVFDNNPPANGPTKPMTFDGNGQFSGNPWYPCPGEVFIHELTHVWQIHNSPNTLAFLCQAGVAAIEFDTGTNVYHYGPSTSLWAEPGGFNPEAQASLVDQWFGGWCWHPPWAPNRNLNGMGNKGEDPSSPDFAGGTSDPYFYYIQNNVRTGKT